MKRLSELHAVPGAAHSVATIAALGSRAMAIPTHLPVVIEHPLDPYAVVSTATPRRLIVFVHGWGGTAQDSWGRFDSPPAGEPWWQESDLLFVGYRSRAESVTATSDRIRRHLEDFYPFPSQDLLVVDGIAVRDDTHSPYEELVLVGHSLGGLVLRRALVDALDEWQHRGAPTAQRPVLLDAALRLFSPASAGFQPRGVLGLIHVLAPTIIDLLRAGGSYADLQRDSPILEETRTRTEKYDTRSGDARALAAALLWADPERVVTTERYATDASSDTVDTRFHPRGVVTHTAVCKPVPGFDVPYRFVASGRQ